MKRDILLFILFGAVVVGGFLSITLSVAKVFVSDINRTQINYEVNLP